MRKHIVHVAGVVLVALVVLPNSVTAACAVPDEAGSWVNVSSEEQTIVRLDIVHVCKDELIREPVQGVAQDSARYTDRGPTWYVEAFGPCGTSECSWSRTGGEAMNGSYTGRSYESVTVHPIFATYVQEGSQFFFYIAMSPEEEGTLTLHIAQGPSTAEELKFRLADPAARAAFMSLTVRPK